MSDFWAKARSSAQAVSELVRFPQLPDSPKSRKDTVSSHVSATKSKLISVWHEVKTTVSPKPRASSFSEAPIWILGKCYHYKLTDSSEETGKVNDRVHIEEFWGDFHSRLWFTYRKNFPEIPGSNYTTDCGWGCMLRSGQMMLGQALMCAILGRDWRPDGVHTAEQQSLYRQILRLFDDTPAAGAPFSIHNLAAQGGFVDKEVGEWHGPSSLSIVLSDILNKLSPELRSLVRIRPYIANDRVIYVDEVLSLCQNSKPADGEGEEVEWSALLLIVPCRLGLERLNEVYISSIKAFLTFPQSIGIIGGRPRHSLYFVGWQEEQAIYLDSHPCHNRIDMDGPEFPTETFHCEHPRKLPLGRMDPSLAVGFLCLSRS
eukprot:Colp12_sorted_trinity150504_noHs@15382